jgi:putative aldouronate transport system substrate-binding protein
MWLRGYPNTGEVVIDPDTGESKAFFADSHSKRWLSDLNDLYNEGLIEPETFVQNYDMYMEKVSSGRVLAFFDETWEFEGAFSTLKAAGKEERLFVPMPVVFDDAGREAAYNGIVAPGSFNGMSITTSAEDPVAVFKFLDKILSDEVQTLINWGIEGEDYLVDGNGKFYRTPEMQEQAMDYNYQLKQGLDSPWWQFPAAAGQMPNGNYYKAVLDPGNVNLMYSDYEKKILDAYGVDTFFEMLPPPRFSKWGKGWDVQIPDGSDAQLVRTKLLGLVNEFYPKMVMAANKSEFEKLWNEYVDKYNKLGIDTYEKFVTEEMQRRMKTWE